MSSPAERALAHVRALAGTAATAPGVLEHARITVSFHPDRLAGGLNLAGHPDGASPRFGSCYLRLTPAVTRRATFSHGDSVTEPTVVGTADTFGALWAALLDEVARTGTALGLAAAGPTECAAALSAPRTAAGRALDNYVEAQVHGGIDLAVDVEAVVADPSFRGTPTGDLLAGHLATRYGAERIDAALIGRAARAVVRAPEQWSAFGPSGEVLQQLKHLWHLLVLLGRPFGG